MYVPTRSPATSNPARSVTTVRLSKADKARKAEDILDKLGDVRAGLPVRKLKDGSAALLDKAIVSLSEYADIVKGGGK